jgi:transcriptional regulator with XRE-family HTH domain
MTILGEKIRKHREAKGLTLEQLAEKIDSTKSYVWEIENKPVARPSADKIFRIAGALDVSAEYLMDDTRRNPSPEERDVVFFRKYQKLAKEDKDVLQRFIDSIGRKK